MNAIVFVNNQQVSIVDNLDDLLKEINHYQAFWLSNVAFAVYFNQKKTVTIKVHNITAEEIKWLSERMR